MTYPNWFLQMGIDQLFAKHLGHLANQEIACLQIGAFTGDASIWMLDNILQHEKSILVDVDTWEGSDEPVHHNMNWRDVYSTYRDKTAENFRKLTPVKSTSDHFFHCCIEHSEQMFDFIYVDGDHTSFAVLKDGINSYERCKVGGIIAFDDYTWSLNKGDFYDPRYGIDALVHLLIGKTEIIEQSNQLWLKKII